MTNLEWLLENDKESVVELLALHEPWGIETTGNKIIKNCRSFPCNGCIFCDTPNCCAIDRENWLNSERKEPLLFPIGTIVEVSLNYNGEKDLQYYNGVHGNKHYCTHFHSYIGKTDSSAIPLGLVFNPSNIRKVGD